MLFKFQWFIIFSCIILFAVSGCAIQSAKGNAKARNVKENAKDRVEMTVDPKRSYEECVTLSENQVLDYSFEASKPVDFNIHYHAEEGIFYPVSQKNVSSWKGTFSPQEEKHYSKEQDYFCMMWENPHAEYVNISCKYKVRGK